MKRIIPLALVLALLMAGVYYVRRADQTEQYQIASLYTEVEPLQKQRETLIAERSTLVEEFKISLRDPSTVQILFREMNSEVFDTVYPLMRERGVTGVLGVSSKEFPGRNKKLTVEQYNRLLMDGWGSCLVFESDYQNRIDSWISYMERHLQKAGLAMPTTVYFPEGGYNPETMDEALLNAGITTVVLNSTDGHSNTVTSVGEFWTTGAMPWNYTGIGSDVELLSLTDSGNLCFTISIENLWDAFEQKSFVALLDSWRGYLVSDSVVDMAVTPTPTPTPKAAGQQEETVIEPMLRVTSFEKARAAHLSTQEGLSRLVQEHEDAIADLDARIEDLTQRIDLIYDKWNKN